uniref:Salivary secreted peptide n=1 Tax=Anopheles funestus TaxID=62324 RepID=A0A4Y0BST5_ANOFN
MKYTIAFVLIALFAMISISQARPHPEEADASAAASTEGASAETKFEVELSPEELAALEALGGRAWNWEKILAAVTEILPYILYNNKL